MARFNVSPSRLGRYYFFECDRFLRYDATPSERRADEGVPAGDYDASPVTQAILDTGAAWEHTVLADYVPDAVVGELPSGGDALTDRVVSYDDTIAALRRATAGTAIYQPSLHTPPSFYDQYGLDPQLVTFGDFRPDLLLVDDWGEGLELRVIDLKATDELKLSHRIQVGIYTLLIGHVLEHEQLPLRRSRNGGVWLYQSPEPEWFPLSSIVPPIETFLERDLTPLLTAPADEAFWHLYYRCEWCPYFAHCRAEAEATDDVSQVPYLSHFAKRHLLEHTAVRTVSDLAALLQRDDADDFLRGSASLEGRGDQLARSVDALQTGAPQPTGAHSAAMPRRDGIRLVLTVQQDPVSGHMFGYAVHRLFGAAIFGQAHHTTARVAPSSNPADLAALRAELVDDLMGILQPIHDHNSATTDWWSQESVQAYVFDTYERELLVSMLLRVIEESDDLDLIERALAVLFHFQHPDLVAADDQPAREVLFPIVVITEVLRSLLALPIPVTYRFADVNRTLQPQEYAFAYREHGFFDFALSNRMRADAVLQAWTGQKPERLDQVTDRLRQRVWATNSILNGLREHLDDHDVLFAYPPKFFLPDSFGFSDPLLSRLAFITQYERVLAYLDVRTRRMKTLPERLRDGDTYELAAAGNGWYEVHPRHVDLDLNPGPFEQRVLTCDTEEGRHGRLVYDEFRGPWPPRNLAVAIASVPQTVEDGDRTWLRLELKHRQHFSAPQPRQRCFLDPLFKDWTSHRVTRALGRHDQAGDSWYAQLLRDPVGVRQRLAPPARLRATAEHIAAEQGMTPSQQQAFAGVLDHDLQLVWGPAGTGKTHFLALAVLALAEASRQADEPLRVLVTAMSHPAIDNLLGKIAELQEAGQVVDGGIAVGKLNSPANDAEHVGHSQAAGWATGHRLSVLGSTVWQLDKVDPDDLQFELLVVDEGSQVKVGEAAIPLRYRSRRSRLVIAGDDKQLPPIVNGTYPELDDEPLLHRSLLECLRDLDPDDVLTEPLVENWRMCDVLCSYPAASVYPADYAPATQPIADQRLPSANTSESEVARLLLDPAHPLVVGVLEGVQATAENQIEAQLVASTTSALRDRFAGEDDAAFWHQRLFIISPHHVQLRAIRRALHEQRAWDAAPFVDTVDKMQGQERDAVIVSYGVSDVEYALGERDFIYSLNRLNVAITRGRAKSIVLLPRPLLEPPIQALDNDRTADGIAYMQGLANWCTETASRELPLGRLTILRRAHP